eukprot:6490622-Amphidinium_carterae.2
MASASDRDFLAVSSFSGHACAIHEPEEFNEQKNHEQTYGFKMPADVQQDFVDILALSATTTLEATMVALFIDTTMADPAKKKKFDELSTKMTTYKKALGVDFKKAVFATLMSEAIGKWLA